MRLNLPTRNFGFFKIATGTIFLFLSFVSPMVAMYSFVVALAVGRGHGLGAWVAMARSKKLTWIYIACLLPLASIITYWGLQIATFETLVFVTYAFFSFHFLFDEFVLQEETRTRSNILASVGPLLFLLTPLVTEYLDIYIPLKIFIVVGVSLLTLEILYLQEVNWFFLHTKILSAFILFSLYFGTTITHILNTLLMFHYFFWFIYPVYKLHKYKREDRDQFIMTILLLIGGSTTIFAISNSVYGPQVYDYTVRLFLIGTLVHALATAPFGYLFGLKWKATYTAELPVRQPT